MTEERGLRHVLRQIFGPRSESEPVRTQEPTPTPASPPSPSVPITAPDTTTALVSDLRVPPKAREKAQAILTTINNLAPRLAHLGATDPVVSEVNRLRTVHLAELLQSYIDIPEEHRAEIFRRTQRSASYHLVASLDTMAARLTDISCALAQGVIDQFTDSTRFVENQYGNANDPFA